MANRSITTKINVSCFINYIAQPSLPTAIQITCSYVKQSRIKQGKDPCGVNIHCTFLFLLRERLAALNQCAGRFVLGEFVRELIWLYLIHACFLR
jgi:hypothetical protein